jgi:alkylation response protein AidB-like acyl-CoA dehydrogenase
METSVKEILWLELAADLSREFAKRSGDYDNQATFVEKNYIQLKEHGFFSATIPTELGGSGISHSKMCDILRVFGQNCGSTALALSMHHHLLAANIWKFKNGQGSEEILSIVADKQPVLISTGAKDLFESNGEMVKKDGGFLVSAQKHFASQSAIGDILVTSAPYEDPEKGWQVLHFTVPMSSDGVTVMDNWYTMGMRGTGSNTVKLKNVFIPDSAVTLMRSRTEYHPFFNVIFTVALPLVMSVYVGIAEKSAELAISHAKDKNAELVHIPYLISEMNNELTVAQVLWRDMIGICNNLDFKPLDKYSHEVITRKTKIAEACIKTVTKSMEVVGGQSFFKNHELERLFRDVQASQFHPLQEKAQLLFSGEFLLK